MPAQEILVLAVTQMLGGVCLAGMSNEAAPDTGLRWIRPVREHGHVLLGDITTADGRVIQPFDVVEMHLLRAHPSPPHTEDWIADFAHRRPRILRLLEGERRAAFLSKHLDLDPASVLDHQTRSLCLVQPDWISTHFELDGLSGKYDARIAFGLAQRRYLGSHDKGGFPVTDLRWRALGRSWLPQAGGVLRADWETLKARLGVHEPYLAVGLTRPFQGACWPIVVGVHVVPDYSVAVDYANL